MSTKRFYWLKLKEDFFDDDAIEWLEEQKNGKEYALFYLKLCLKSLKTDGLLMRKVGNMQLPYDANKLAEITRTPPDTVMVAMDLLTKIGYVEVMDGGALYMTQLAGMVGSETQDAVRMRKKRAQQALEAAQNSEHRTLSEQYSDNVSTNVRAEYRDRERDRDRDIEIERDKDAEQAAPAPLSPSQSESEISKKKKSVKPEKPVKHKHGEYGNVLLTDKELETLRGEFPHDLQTRIERLSEYIASTGKAYKSHFATIRAWAKKDAERGAPAAAAGSGQQINPMTQRAIQRLMQNTRPHEAATVERWEAEKDAPKKTTGNDEELRARAQALRDKLQKEVTP